MKKVLFVTPNNISDSSNGGNLVSKRNLSILRKVCGCGNVKCVQLLDRKDRSTPISNVIDRLRGFFAGLTGEALEEIITESDNYDVVFLDTSLYGNLASVLKKRGYGGRVVTFYHNIEYVFYRNVNTAIRLTYPLSLYPVRKVERKAAKYSDLNITLNERDAFKLNEYYGGVSGLQLPVSLDGGLVPDAGGTHVAGTPLHILFFGSAFFANIHGIKWFLKNVMPYIDATLTIAGNGMDCLGKFVAASRLKNVSLYGYVDDVDAFYEKADIVVLPIFEGSGMKVKTCEALKYGKIAVGTEEALTGYGRTADIYCCNTRGEFISCLTELGKKTFGRFSESNRQLFCTCYETGVMAKRLKTWLYDDAGQ